MALMSRDEVYYLSELQNFNPDELYDRIVRVCQLCDIKREEMYDMWKDLKKDRKTAVKIDQKYKKDKVLWTGIRCLALVGGSMACFVPGVGWVVGGCIVAANAGAVYGDYKNDKNNQADVNQLIGEIARKTQNVTTFAEVVNKKKADFDRERIRLISQGMDEKHASIILIMSMMYGLFPNQPQLVIGVNQEANMARYATVPVFFSTDKVGDYSSKLLKDIFGAIEITPELLQKVCVCAAVVGVAWNVYSCAKTCLNTSEAVEKIEDIMDVLDEGQHSMQFFINLLNYIRESLLRQKMFSNSAEIGGRLNELTLASDNRITALSTQLTEHNMVIDQHLDEINNRLYDLSLKSDNDFDSLSTRLDEQNLNVEHQINSIESQVNSIMPNISHQMELLQNEIAHLRSQVNFQQQIGGLREEMGESQQNLNRRMEFILEQNQIQQNQNQMVNQAIFTMAHSINRIAGRINEQIDQEQIEQAQNDTPRAIDCAQQNVSDFNE